MRMSANLPRVFLLFLSLLSPDRAHATADIVCGASAEILLENLALAGLASADDMVEARVSVAFENIRQDGSDLLVDVFVTPRQKLLHPNGGESLTGSVAVLWEPRLQACINAVEIQVSRDGGQTYTHLADEANDGTYYWYPAADDTGDQYRIRIISRDEAGGQAADESSANFTVRSGSSGGDCFPVPCIIERNGRLHSSLEVREGRLSFGFGTAEPGMATCELFDVQGRLVAQRAAAWYPAGYHPVNWDVGRVPPGIYLVRVRDGRRWAAQAKLSVVP